MSLLGLGNMPVPPPHIQQYLPSSILSVHEFLAFRLPLCAPGITARLMRIQKYTSNQPPNIDDITIIMSLLPPPESIVSALQQTISSGQIKSILCPHSLTDGGHRFPLWVATFWSQLSYARKVQERWKTAVRNLEAQMKQKTGSLPFYLAFNSLSRIPWMGRLPGFSIDLHQLSIYFTQEWLTDDHELAMLDNLKKDLLATGRNNMFIENTHFMSLLGNAYKDREQYDEEKCYDWLHQRGEELAIGDKRYLITIANQNNVHWVAVILDFDQQHILYGDSKGCPICPKHLAIIDWWTMRHANTCFELRLLPIESQTDDFSCGILAWDALQYYFGLKSSLWNPTYPFENRAETFLQLTKCFNCDENIENHHERECDEDIASLDESVNLCSTFDDTASLSDGNGFNSEYAFPDDSSASDYSISELESTNSQDAPLQIKEDLAKVPTSVKRGRSCSQATILPETPEKKARTHKSSIRTALEKGEAALAKNEQPKGLLQYFKKATEEEHCQYRARMEEEIRNQMDDVEYQTKKAKERQEARTRVHNRERKRLQRARLRKSEIGSGLRSPGGSKKKRVVVDLKYHPKLDLGDTLPELSRPAKVLNEKFKDKRRKPQGRKATLPKKKAVYTNWFTPFLFQQIEAARIMAGGPTWSTRAIERELKKSSPDVFEKFSRTTLDEWIDRSGAKPRWSDRTLARIKKGNDAGHENGGRKGVLLNHPEVTDSVKTILTSIRAAGASISLVTARAIMLATILTSAPEILDKKFPDGSTFQASESFMRYWLHDAMHWSRRKATQAAQKKPLDWEDQCEKSFLRKAYLIKEEDIPAELFINSDQTQVVYAPGDKMTWAETGSKQVALVGEEEKRAFTILVSIACSGTVLPMQAIYSGKTKRSWPSEDAPNYDDLVNSGFLLQESGTATYWSNIDTMKDFVDHILAPYFERVKADLKLPSSQKSLWLIDVWSVHRSKEFRSWMKEKHPRIILDFVPGGCTSVAQPCDVGIQRPFKLSVKRSYHEDTVYEVMEQLQEGTTVNLDSRLGTLRNQSTRWIWNAYQTIRNESLVKKAFEKCIVREWDLSYNCLTGIEARSKLHNLRETSPDFWKELTSQNNTTDLPPENILQPEDNVIGQIDELDDSDVPIQIVIDNMVKSGLTGTPEGYRIGLNGKFEAKGDAEGFDEGCPVENEVRDGSGESGDKELGRGKRNRRANGRYNDFWRHN